MVSKLDLTRPVQTRDGRPARILATDLIGQSPIAAAVSNIGPYDYKQLQSETVFRYSASGHFCPVDGASEDCPLDLVNVRVKRTKLVYLYESDKGYDVVSLAPPELRRRFVNADPIAAKFVEFTEGEFE